MAEVINIDVETQCIASLRCHQLLRCIFPW